VSKQAVWFALIHPVNQRFVKDDPSQPHFSVFERPLSVYGRKDFARNSIQCLKSRCSEYCVDLLRGYNRNYINEFTAGYKIKSYLVSFLCYSKVEKEQEVFR